jgi:hypothetical protein
LAFNGVTYGDVGGTNQWRDTTLTRSASGGASTSFLSDLPFVQVANGWGPVERDRSNGHTGANDGSAIRLNGVTYLKGLGVHAFSDVRYAMNGACSNFSAKIGVDDESDGYPGSSVVFQVWLDGSKVYDSGVRRDTSTTQTFSLNVRGRNELKLVVTDAGDGINSDHADWADAQLICSGSGGPGSGGPGGGTIGGNGFTLIDEGNRAVSLVWQGGTAQASYTVERFSDSGNRTINHPGTATGSSDTVPVSAAAACYQVSARNSAGGIIRISDILCVIPGLSVGNVPRNFKIALNQSNAATLSWNAVGGTSSYFVWPVGTSRFQLVGNTTATDNTGGSPTCYVVLPTVFGAPTGISNGLCALPGTGG